MIATIGYFDGVHRGHQQVLQRLVEMARDTNDRSLVITFAQHPKADMPLLTTLNERKQKIYDCGVDIVDILDFPTIKHLTAQQFMHQILREELHVKTLLMGYDHRFGSDQIIDFRAYQAMGEHEGIKVIYLPQFAPQGKHISSSVIRNLIEQGDIDSANYLLGYQFSITGNVIQGRQIGRQIGFPTANIEPQDLHKIIPGTGVYVANVYVDTMTVPIRGMLNIGTNPTVGGHESTIEVHLINYSDNLYDKTLNIEFLHRLRGEIHFQSVEDLQHQLRLDKQAVIDYK